ncbi:hypothetical protein EON65_51355 [archaeon]|nr:MAG: hypothetical protein EON65_51355 [archaeon]
MTAIFRSARPANAEEPFYNIGESLLMVLESNPLPNPLSSRVVAMHHPENVDLYLLPGSINITSFEENLAAAETMKASFTRNIPGAIHHHLQQVGHAVGAKVILIDTSPSMGCLNRVVVMSSSYWLMPCQADHFSLEALKSARRNISNTWVAKMAELRDYTKISAYPLPDRNPIFLRVINQMFTIKRGRATLAFRTYIDRINTEVTAELIPALQQHNMLSAMKRLVCRPIASPQ